jgi:hypothetical protein
MAYTPQLSLSSSRTLRRIAWALDKPMTETIEIIFCDLPNYLDPRKICVSCRDKTQCHDCVFAAKKAIIGPG